MMANEYKLSYTASEIDRKLGMVDKLSNYITPQMFGAVGDGVADDTNAIQAAFNAGGEIYFPAGRYKVTRQLTATKSCKISMFKPYPTTWQGDYPTNTEDNWMGARIETCSTEGYGLLIGDSVEIDGLFMRAIEGFEGVLFKFDGTLGCATYPSQVRLSHIILDTSHYAVVPEAMFDFVPNGTYNHILDDIMIGTRKTAQFCQYGFRSVMTTNDTNWGNSVRINNLCVDILADYCVYVVGGAFGCSNWVFENMTVQSYPYDPTLPHYHNKEGHIDLITLKNTKGFLFLGGYVWDLHAADVLGKVFRLENTIDVACFGCGKEFDAIEMALKEKLQVAADNLNIYDLSMSVETLEETGANRLTLSDGEYERTVDIPSVSVSDEQLDKGIDNWFETNAKPSEQAGRNKFDPFDADTLNGLWNVEQGKVISHANMTTTNYIEAEYGDTVRVSKDGGLVACFEAYFYDENKNYLSTQDWTDSGTHIISVKEAKYVRLCWSKGVAEYVNRGDAKICITVNNPLVEYEPYSIELVGGIGSFVVLQSQNGTQYTLSVDNSGELVANPVSGSESGGSDSGGDEETGDLLGLSDRTQYKSDELYWLDPTTPRLIQNDVYISGVDIFGYWNGNSATICSVNGNNISVTSMNRYGIGIPVRLKKGNKYSLSITSDSKFYANLLTHNPDGTFNFDTPLLDNVDAGAYTINIVPSEAAYYILVLRANEGETVSFSDISLINEDALNSMPDDNDNNDSLSFVSYKPQELTEEQKAQARANIGAMEAVGDGIVLQSPNGIRYSLGVSDDGTLSVVLVSE